MNYNINVNVDVVDVGHGFSAIRTTKTLAGQQLSVKERCLPTTELNESTALNYSDRKRYNIVLPDNFDLSTFAKQRPHEAFGGGRSPELSYAVDHPWSTAMNHNGAVSVYLVDLDRFTVHTPTGRQLPTATHVDFGHFGQVIKHADDVGLLVSELRKLERRQLFREIAYDYDDAVATALLTPTPTVWDALLRQGKPGTIEFERAAVEFVIGL